MRGGRNLLWNVIGSLESDYLPACFNTLLRVLKTIRPKVIPKISDNHHDNIGGLYE